MQAYILYYFRQENELPLNNFIFHPDDLSEEVKTIAYVDDVTLSVGQQGQAFGYIKKTREKYFKDIVFKLSTEVIIPLNEIIPLLF